MQETFEIILAGDPNGEVHIDHSPSDIDPGPYASKTIQDRAITLYLGAGFSYPYLSHIMIDDNSALAYRRAGYTRRMSTLTKVEGYDHHDYDADFPLDADKFGDPDTNNAGELQDLVDSGALESIPLCITAVQVRATASSYGAWAARTRISATWTTLFPAT